MYILYISKLSIKSEFYDSISYGGTEMNLIQKKVTLNFHTTQ